MTDVDKALSVALTRTEKSFSENELAYLIVTSKIELPFRDRLAFNLHQQSQDWRVAREWKRIDLAILTPCGNPVALLEAKAMYMFDPLLTGSHYMTLTINDEQKALKSAQPDTQVYSLLLSAHLHSEIGKDLIGVTKYSTTHNRFVKRHGSAETIRELARAKIREELKGRTLIAHNSFSAGKAFGIEASLDYWLIKHSREGATA